MNVNRIRRMASAAISFDGQHNIISDQIVIKTTATTVKI